MALTSTSPFVFLVIVVFTIFNAGHNGCSAFTSNSMSSSNKNPSSSLSSKTTTRKGGSLPLMTTALYATERSVSGTSYYPSSGSGGATTPTMNKAQYALDKARSFAYGDDYDHDDDILLHGDSTLKYWPIDEAKFWLQELKSFMEEQSNNGVDSDSSTQHPTPVTSNDVSVSVTDIASRLQSKIERHERRIAKRRGAQSVVPWIATELSLGALLLVLAIFWTTLDMDQRYEAKPLNIQEWVAMIKEGGYLFNLMDYYIFGSGI